MVENKNNKAVSKKDLKLLCALFVILLHLCNPLLIE